MPDKNNSFAVGKCRCRLVVVSKCRLNFGINNSKFVCRHTHTHTHTHTQTLGCAWCIIWENEINASSRSGNGIYYFIIPYWPISHDSSRSGVVRTSANNCVGKYASYFLQFSTVTVRKFFV